VFLGKPLLDATLSLYRKYVFKATKCVPSLIFSVVVAAVASDTSPFYPRPLTNIPCSWGACLFAQREREKDSTESTNNRAVAVLWTMFNERNEKQLVSNFITEISAAKWAKHKFIQTFC